MLTTCIIDHEEQNPPYTTRTGLQQSSISSTECRVTSNSALAIEINQKSTVFFDRYSRKISRERHLCSWKGRTNASRLKHGSPGIFNFLPWLGLQV